MTVGKWIAALLPLGLLAGLAIFLAIGLTRDPGELPSALIDTPLPEYTAETLTGDELALETLTDDVTLLNVFGSWCVACLQEHPLFMEVSDDERFALIGINWRDRPEARDRWLDRHGDPYDSIILDPNSRLAIALGVSGAPETFIVGPDGRIRYRHTGPISRADWDNILSPLIDQLHAESTGEAEDRPL